jgi:diacylglycerol kinase family enzyme
VSETVAVIINPISGAGRRPDVARQRAERATAFLLARGVGGEVFVTERAGHARELALGALGRGATLCVAWGGDGTVNEVASALAFSAASVAIIPSGSGNGLSREVGIPFDPKLAFAIAISGRDRVIDAGEIEGRLFFNLAGVGLDARIAHQFAATGLSRRGFVRYLEIAGSEIFHRAQHDYVVAIDGQSRRTRALLVAIANGRQYGNGKRRADRTRRAHRRRVARCDCGRRSFAVGRGAARTEAIPRQARRCAWRDDGGRHACRDHLDRADDLSRRW